MAAPEATTPASSNVVSSRLLNPTIFICDVQERFRAAIYEYAQVISTAQKVLAASQVLKIPVVATTQLRGKLGPTCPELRLDEPDGIPTICHSDKSRFSMWTPEVQAALAQLSATPEGSAVKRRAIAIVGIEAHICVTQTTLDLLSAGHMVYILADGVSSCNANEVPIALARLRQAGAIVTTSESWLYEVMGDAGIPEFKAMAGLVKENSARTKEAVGKLCRI